MVRRLRVGLASSRAGLSNFAYHHMAADVVVCESTSRAVPLLEGSPGHTSPIKPESLLTPLDRRSALTGDDLATSGLAEPCPSQHCGGHRVLGLPQAGDVPALGRSRATPGNITSEHYSFAQVGAHLAR